METFEDADLKHIEVEELQSGQSPDRILPSERTSLAESMLKIQEEWMEGEVVLSSIVCEIQFDSMALRQEGTLYLTNFKLFFKGSQKDDNTNQTCIPIPNTKIANVYIRDPGYSGFNLFESKVQVFRLEVKAKDIRRILFNFRDAQKRKIVMDHIETYSFFGTAHDDIKEYIFTFNRSLISFEESSWIYDPYQEFQRLGSESPDCKGYFALTTYNENYEICPTYPRYLLMPAEVELDDIVGSSQFRSSKRLPSIVWFDSKTRATLSRSSQPQVGVTRNRSTYDENLISSIFRTNKSYGQGNHKMYIIDARSGNAAMANFIGGYGYENHENYGNNTNIQFMNIPNIHSVRASYKAFYDLCVTLKIPDRSHFEQTGWFNTIKLLLEGASTIARMIDEEGSSVLIHCSDGWDRTSQLTSLTQIMLDPYFRTLKGFSTLIQKEWLSFGHKFEHRTGVGIRDNASNEISPIFEQWMDCVYQILIQFPNWFEFNEDYLIAIVDALHDSRYGDFIFNCEKDRRDANIAKRCASVWTHFENICKETPLYYSNPHYQQVDKTIYPATTTSKLQVWDSFYLRYNLTFKLHQEYRLLSKEKNKNLCEIQHELKEVKELLQKEQYEKWLYYKSILAVKDGQNDVNSVLEELEDLSKLRDGQEDCEIRFSIKNGRVIGCAVIKDKDTITRKYVGNLNLCKIEDYENRTELKHRKIRTRQRDVSLPVASYKYKDYLKSLYDIYDTLKQTCLKVVQ